MNLPDLPPITISEEALIDRPNVVQQMMQLQADAYYRSERAALAEMTSEELAWSAFPPIPSDDPAEWEPYWTRLSDIPDKELRDAVVAKFWEQQRRR